MSELNLNEIKNYILAEGKEYRRNILLYLKWVLEDFENRKEVDASKLVEAFNLNKNLNNAFYIEGIKTIKEWNRVKQGAEHNYLIEHKTPNNNGFVIALRLNEKDTLDFFNQFNSEDIPNEIILWKYKMPTKDQYIEATKLYNEKEWAKSNLKVQINNKEYYLKALSMIAIGIANNLDSPANHYLFSRDNLKKYISENFKDFKIIVDEENKNFLKYKDKNENNQKEGNMPNNNNQPLNQILYGPPGTGKTYNTINRALEIIENKSLNELEKEDRKELKKRFDEYKEKGQVEFVTFHQSYGYEEFVEGIKADLESDEIKYKLEEGVFKKLCEKAQKENNFDEVYGKFLTDLNSKEFMYLETIKQNKKFKIFRNSSDSIVVKPDTDKATEMTITKKMIKEYLLNKRIIDWKSYVIPISEYIKKEYNFQLEDNSNKNYILIIDEINRGNISKIFGELITLIEDSKRIGADEEIKVKLPYSNNKEFGVPKNLYIIGTMNTADRSIAPIDTALRRRFVFEEMPPKPELLSSNVDEIDLQKLLEAINKRIEYLYDREHCIGHSYFIGIDSFDDLKFEFKNKIIPLLAEYFYEDWENINLVLNENGMIKEISKNNYLTIEIKNKISGNKIYKITSEDSWNEKTFQKIYDDNIDKKEEKNNETSSSEDNEKSSN